jgi:hypothetical protein
MHDMLPYGGLEPERVHLNEAPKLYECELLSALLRCTTTPAERKFAEAYYHLAISWVDFPEDANTKIPREICFFLKHFSFLCLRRGK